MEWPRDAGAVAVDDVLPPDPLDGRARLRHPMTVLKVPDEQLFLERLKDPRRFIRPIVHVVESLYGGRAKQTAAAASAFGFIPTELADGVLEHNPAMRLNRKRGRRLPVPQRPLFQMPNNFLWPFRGVDWAALRIQCLDDGVSDPTDRILAVAAHNGILVEGFEDRVRAGMLDTLKSARLAAWMVADKLPCPKLPPHPLGSPKWQKALRPVRSDLSRYDVEKTLDSPHYWWAVEYTRRAWDYVAPNTPVDCPAMSYGDYEVRNERGHWVSHLDGKRPKARDLMTYLETTARADLAQAPRPRDITQTGRYLAAYGLIAFRLPDDRALPERVGYCSYITPRGWRTLWADGRMLECHDVVAEMTQAPNGSSG